MEINIEVRRESLPKNCKIYKKQIILSGKYPNLRNTKRESNLSNQDHSSTSPEEKRKSKG